MYVLYQKGSLTRRPWPSDGELLAHFQTDLAGPIEMIHSSGIPDPLVGLMNAEAFLLGPNAAKVTLDDGIVIQGPIILCAMNAAGDDFGPIPPEILETIEIGVFPGMPPRFRIALDGDLRSWGP